MAGYSRNMRGALLLEVDIYICFFINKFNAKSERFFSLLFFCILVTDMYIIQAIQCVQTGVVTP